MTTSLVNDSLVAAQRRALQIALPEERPQKRMVRYAAALASVAAGLGLRLALAPLLQSKAPYITFFPAVMLAGWFGGLGPGLLATALSALAAGYFVVRPVHSFRFEDSGDWIAFLSFLLVSSFITSLNEALRRSHTRSEVRVQQLARETARRTLAEESLEQQVAERTAQLQAANRELEEFAYAASHDLKAPLRVIDNASRWLEEDLAEHLNQQTSENMNLLRGRVKRMEKLLDDLLEYAKAGRATAESYSETVAGNELLNNILELLSPAGFTVKVSPAFAYIPLKRMPLQQIFMNLIGNAVKHHDKKTGNIEVTVEEDGANFVFAVKDDGPGIPPQFQDKVFQMFQTLRPRDQLEGSGMGLALVRKNIEVFGGRIWLESDEGKGCIFRFTWPKEQRLRAYGMAAHS
jgi:signal transduction histidine kinase